MQTTTDRHAQDTAINEAALYVALELSSSKWKLAFDDGRRKRARIATIDAMDVPAFITQVERARSAMGLPENAPVRTCYEAGREGFSIHRRLAQLGIDNVVIDAASVEVSRRARRAKTDRLDAEALVAKLISHHRGDRAFAVVRIPAPEDEAARHEDRHLGDLKVERGRHRVRIQSLLLTEGIGAKWSPRLVDELETMRTIDGRALSSELVRRIRDEAARLETVRTQIATIEAARKVAMEQQEREPRAARAATFASLKGIGSTSAFRLVVECFGWRKFKTRREVAGCLGLAPSPFASGFIDHEQGISKLGNGRLRALLVELSWLWLRFQPQSKISLWFQEKFARGAGRSRRIGIVAVARKLAIALWKLTAFGEVPEGAIMKT
jgi:transposase